MTTAEARAQEIIGRLHDDAFGPIFDPIVDNLFANKVQPPGPEFRARFLGAYSLFVTMLADAEYQIRLCGDPKEADVLALRLTQERQKLADLEAES